MTCRAILFDLDGVLVDSTASVGRVWGRWAAEHGLNAAQVVRSAHGRRSIETIRHWLPLVDAVVENRRVEQMEIDDTPWLHVVPGARELLASIPNRNWGIVTSGTRALACSRLSVAGLAPPPVLITADDVSLGKPHPGPWLQGAAKLGVKPKQCVVIEDTPPGIQSAHGAGMRALALTSTCPFTAVSDAEAVVDSLSDIRIKAGANGRLMLRVRCADPPWSGK
ncbi:MAG: HAD-IA family hydrolase [Terriglobales bacterium]